MDIRLPRHLRSRVQELEEHATSLANAGYATLSSAYRGAADALARRDEITAEHWFEKADVARHLMRKAT